MRKTEPCRLPTLRPPGPGNYLHDLIKRRTGENYRAGCGCESMVAQMNTWGPSGCRAHLDEIVAKMLTEAKVRPKWKLLVTLPGSKLFMKRMVLSAIREAIKWMDINHFPEL